MNDPHIKIETAPDYKTSAYFHGTRVTMTRTVWKQFCEHMLQHIDACQIGEGIGLTFTDKSDLIVKPPPLPQSFYDQADKSLASLKRGLCLLSKTMGATLIDGKGNPVPCDCEDCQP